MKNAVWIGGVLIVGVIGLFLLMNLSEESTQPTTTKDTSKATEDAFDASIPTDFRTNARLSIEALIADIEAGAEASELFADTVATIRADLAKAYQQASAEAQAQWPEVEASFIALEESLRTNAGDVFDRLIEVTLRLSARI